MNRSLLVVLIVVVLALGGFVAWWLITGQTLTNDNENTTTTNTVLTNTGNYGALEVGREATYQSVNFQFTTASFVPTFNSQTAPDGKQYLIIYYRPLQNADDSGLVASLASTGITLTAAGDKSYPVKEVKVVTPVSGSYDEGYLWFEVDQDATDFSLNFGSVSEPFVLDLNL